jgi:carbon-monoxide dehydrogenase large subunit
LSLQQSTKTGIGQPVRGREDFRLLTGKGCYSDDYNLPGQAYAVMVRCRMPLHAFARSMRGWREVAPGVLAMLTGREMLEDVLQAIPHSVGTRHPTDITLENMDGSPPFIPPHLPMTAEEAHHSGKIVAAVVAAALPAAKDGAELVAVDYEPLPSVTHSIAALQTGAPFARSDARANISIDAEVGDKAATDAAFAKAAHIVTFETWIPRIVGVPMEPRAAAPTTRRAGATRSMPAWEARPAVAAARQILEVAEGRGALESTLTGRLIPPHAE